MYNIDFKVSGQIVSIKVMPNDTLETLIDQMRSLSLFKKYSHTQLEDKLVRNLTQVSLSLSIDPQIKKRLDQLINPKVEFKFASKNEKPTELKHNLNNNTFVNLLQQSSVNNSYLEKGVASETKLRRKYISNQESDEDFIQDKLKFNYNKANLTNTHQTNPPNTHQTNPSNTHLTNPTNIHKFQPEKTPSFNQPTPYKRSFSYLHQQPTYAKNPQTNYPINDFLKKHQDKNSNTHCRNSLEKSPKHQKAYNYCLQTNYNQHNQYNPVPKLNELIQRSKSLSMMVQMNSGLTLKDKNMNLPYESIKITPNSESLGIQKRKTVGKIHHRHDLCTQSIKNEFKQQKSLIRSKENQTKERQKLAQRPQFQLKMNYGTEKVYPLGQNTGMRSLVVKKYDGQRQDYLKRKDVKKGIYSYL